jgi:pimeloyl-ACP methyl ester carboxylesterase
VRAVVSFYAPVDLIWSYDNPANERVIDGKKTLRQFVGGSPHDSPEMRENYLRASPTSHVKNGTPPTLLIHGGQDQLVRSENMYRLAERLKERIFRTKPYLSPTRSTVSIQRRRLGRAGRRIVLLAFLRENTAPEP